ncbi:MAG: LysR family transcriptional regulator [Candidatus Promineifilaceae bacterium]|nr:LysR family transcriptional regulator [Anaerolineaceae bacterium]
MLDAHQLNVFLTAARTLNFTAAARQLHMTQPSVSQHIQALEQHFDLQLFIRAGRHLRLTDAGEALLPMAQEMVSISQSIDNKMQSLKGDVYGRLTVGCSTTVGKYVLPLLLASFMQQYPKVEASCYVTPRKIAVQMLTDGEVNVALASKQELNNNLEFCRFITDKVCLIVPLNHPWADRESVEPKELLQANFIWREEGSGTRYVAEEKMREHGIVFEQMRTVLTLGNSEAIALAVQEGIGVAFVSQMIITRIVEGKVKPVKVRGMEIEQEIFIGRDANRMGTTAQTAFWKFVTDPKNPVLNRLMESSKEVGDFSFAHSQMNGHTIEKTK